MRAITSIFRHIMKLREFVLRRITYRAEIRNIEKKKYLWDKVSLTQEQESKVRDFWKVNAGIDNFDTRWNLLYQSYTNIFDERYFPEIFYSTIIENKIANPNYALILQDKNLLSTLFPGNCNRGGIELL